MMKQQTNLVENYSERDSESSSLGEEPNDICVFDVCEINDDKQYSKIYLKLKTGNTVIKFEVDSGSPVTLMSIADKNKYLKHMSLQESNIELRSYCGNKIQVLGFVNVKVRLNNVINDLRLFVVEGNRHPLLGREWMHALKLDWNEIMGCRDCVVNKVSSHTTPPKLVDDLIKQFPTVFDNSVGKMENIQASLTLKPNSKPVFLKARTLPFSIREIVEKEIESLVQNGVLIKVNHSEWATPVVPVIKSQNRVRLCGDYKLTVNRNLLVDEHPLPTIDELFANMAGGVKFSKIDLTQAYLQMAVREEDQRILTLNTHLGLFQPTRLMYGVASAPAIFQREISQILQGIPGVSVFLDDVEITGPDDKTHLARLHEVLRRFQSYNMRINLSKCVFFADSIEYCGYVVDCKGIHKMEDKVTAIQEMPAPKNKEQVRAFMGLVNYYGKFLPGLSSKMYPINNLLKDNAPFVWDRACEDAFKWVKCEMQCDRVLVHYDMNLPLVLATDASPYGVGAVLSHIYPDGSERPIQYASQTLNSTQQKYAQVDKEVYAIIFGVKKFHQYLFGRKFILLTDNKPVAKIFSPDKGLPTLSATRMQHYAVFLESFDFEIRFRNSKFHANADGMSRLPIPNSSGKPYFELADVLEIQQIETLPVSVEELAQHTAKDLTVRNLIQALQTGRLVEGHDRFGINQNEFSIQKGRLMRGIRVYIPPTLRRKVLEELHAGHFGISRMKSLARSYCWWCNIDNDIADLTQGCIDCARTRPDPAKAPVHSWERPTEPFQRIHVDFAGPFMGQYFLIVIDAYSKWPEIKVIPDMTTETTIQRLREFFATFGIPSVIVTDRGTQFTSDQFKLFLKNNGITHKMGAPYHPATNGQAERYVQTVKDKLKALKCSRSEINMTLLDILSAYRRTVHPATGKSPSMLVFGRQLKTRIDLMIPSVDHGVSSRNSLGEEKRKSEYDLSMRTIGLQLGILWQALKSGSLVSSLRK